MAEAVGFDWKAVGEIGIGIVAIGVIFMIVKLFVEQWRRSTDAQIIASESQVKTAKALEKNAESYDRLAEVFEKSYEREIEFQKEARWMLKDNLAVARDTQQKVNEMHTKIVQKEGSG